MPDDPYLELRRCIAKGEQARVLSESVVFNDMLKQVENDAISQWKLARGPSGAGTREHAHGIVVGIEAIRGHVEMMINDGELARSKLDQLTDDDEQE